MCDSEEIGEVPTHIEASVDEARKALGAHGDHDECFDFKMVSACQCFSDLCNVATVTSRSLGLMGVAMTSLLLY